MAGYVVKGAAVVLPTPDKSERYFYRGAVVEGDGFTEAGIAHAVGLGLLAEVAPVEVVPVVAVALYPEGEPSEEWKADELDAYAANLGVKLGAGKNKAEKVAAILAATSA